MRLVPGQFRPQFGPVPSGANSQGYVSPEFDRVEWRSSTVVFGCTYTVPWAVGEIFGPRWINLSQPMTAPNFHLRNLELLAEQGCTPQRIIWVMPDPNRITVFDHADRVLRWGVSGDDRWNAQGQTTDWDRALRLRTWQRAAESFGCEQLWLTWSQRTHHLVQWDLVGDPDGEDWLKRLTQRVQQWAK